VLATPGHTDTHLAYVVEDTTDPVAAPAVFTGGSLLFGSVGRTDLVDPDRTEELTRAQYHSTRRLADLLPDEAAVYPTHGFGSFCSSGSSTGGDASTVGQERVRNDALLASDEDTFVSKLIAGLTAYPRYYAHMAARNRQGPTAPDLSPPEPIDSDDLRRRVKAGEWVVDLRDRTAYAAQHIGGTIGIALGEQFSTYLGWLIPWDTPLTLIGENPQQVTDAQRQLVRIGIDRPAGAAVGEPDELATPDELRQYPSETFDALAQAQARGDRPVVLDVRRDDERALGFIPGSTHIPLHSLMQRLSEVPDGQLWVHCAAGFRASIAASLLDRAGHNVILVDDDYGNAVESGLAILPPGTKGNVPAQHRSAR
jgi:rhodanese-related sulfurtransferase